MVRPGTFTVWCRLVAEPPTRWHPMPHLHNISALIAKREVEAGQRRAELYAPYLRYAICNRGESPNDAELPVPDVEHD